MKLSRKDTQTADRDKISATTASGTPVSTAHPSLTPDTNPTTKTESWELLNWWPDLFIVHQKIKPNEKTIYRVEMDSALEAKFSALSRGTTDHQAGPLYHALWKSHLLRLHEEEFGGLFSSFQEHTMNPDAPLSFSQMDPVHLAHLEDIVEIARLLNNALFPELESLVYQDENAEGATRALELRFSEALKTFSRTVSQAYTKKTNRLYIYKKAVVSLPWLAIRCAYDFVIKHRRLPNQMELKVDVEEASKSWKKIRRATWSDALKTAGLSMLDQAKKHTSKKYRDEVRKNAASQVCVGRTEESPPKSTIAGQDIDRP